MFDATTHAKDPARPVLGAGELRALVCRAAAAFDPDTVAPETAERVMREWATIEHAAATAKAMAAARAATGAAVRDAGRRDAAEWVASRTGTTTAAARDALSTAKRLRDLPATSAAARRGELSPSQTSSIADAAAAAPGAEAGLLAAAGRESVGELRERCARTKAAADRDPDATRRRIHAARGLRRYGTADGLHHLHAAGPAETLAAIDAALRPFIEARFTAARKAGERDTHEAYAFDALANLADAASRPTTPTPPPAGAAPGAAAPAASDDPAAPGAAASGAGGSPDDPAAPGCVTAPAPSVAAAPGAAGAAPGTGDCPATPAPGAVQPAVAAPARRSSASRYRVIVRADLDALVRGVVRGDEICDIAGVGPVPAATVRDLLGDSILELVLTRGTAVANVTHLGRGPSGAQRLALLWQGPACARQGCNQRGRLEVDHNTPWAQHHVTELANLQWLCHHDHRRKTHDGWALVAGTGRRPMVPPGHPDHPTRPGPRDDPPPDPTPAARHPPTAGSPAGGTGAPGAGRRQAGADRRRDPDRRTAGVDGERAGVATVPLHAGCPGADGGRDHRDPGRASAGGRGARAHDTMRSSAAL